MADRQYRPLMGSLDAGVVSLFGSITLGTSGAVASSTGKGLTIAKTGSETGRYTITLSDKYFQFLGASLAVELAADAAAGSDGFIPSLRGVDLANNVLYIQLSDAAGADTEGASGFKIYFRLDLRNSSVTR